MHRFMIRLVLTFLVAGPGGCSDGSDDPEDGYDAQVEEFADLLCGFRSGCTAMPDEACVNDVRADLADAKDVLDEAGEARCTECLRTQSAELQKVFAQQCNIRAADEDAIRVVCDLDLAVDADADGIADNDFEEACAGQP